MDFEACSGFTRVTARWIARPPEAAFVTRLRPVRLPVQAARQLPDQSTTFWAEPSSAGDTRLRGAPKRSQLSRALNDFFQADRCQPPQCSQKHRPDYAGRQTCSRRNAFRHGLTAETVIGALEDAEDYKAFEAAIIADYDAQSAVERELVLD